MVLPTGLELYLLLVYETILQKTSLLILLIIEVNGSQLQELCEINNNSNWDIKNIKKNIPYCYGNAHKIDLEDGRKTDCTFSPVKKKNREIK